MLLICMSKLADILNKKTTGVASWAFNNCTISDTEWKIIICRDINYTLKSHAISI